MRFEAHLPIEFWSFCVLIAGYLINRTPSSILKGKTPFEMLYNKPPLLDVYAMSITRDMEETSSRLAEPNLYFLVILLGRKAGKSMTL